LKGENEDRQHYPRWAIAPSGRADLDYSEMAQLIERFLDGTSLYPQEWNDFVDCSQSDPEMEVYRKRCDELDPLVNEEEDPDPAAVSELRSMIETLRQKSGRPDVGRKW
jgi:hypothetical protein